MPALVPVPVLVPLPLVPALLVATLFRSLDAIRVFDLVFVLTAGGPGGKTMLPMLFAYNEAFKYNHWGLAAAMGNVMVIVIAVFLLLYLRGQARSRSAR